MRILRGFEEFFCLRSNLSSSNIISPKSQAPVVQTLDSDIHRINCYPADKYQGNQLRYPLDRFISDGRIQCHPTVKQPRPGLKMAVYEFQRSGLKTGVENNIFWSEIGSGFGLERGSTLPPRIPRSKPPPPPRLTETCLRFGVNGAIVQKGFWDQFRFLGNCPPTPAGYKRMLFFFLQILFKKQITSIE